MESKTSRYQSRILREMHQNTENPFSPPSSTGSHGTVTLTSDISQLPEGESTRRMDSLSVRLPHQNPSREGPSPRRPLSFNINTSVLGRTFPEWKGWNPNVSDDEKDTWEIARERRLSTRFTDETKENIPPSPSSSVAATTGGPNPNRNKLSDVKDCLPTTNDTREVNDRPSRTRVQMQPTVQDDLESSAVHRSTAKHGDTKGSSTHSSHRQSSSLNGAKDVSSRRGNVTTLLETLKTAQNKHAESRAASPKQSPPQLSQGIAATTPRANISTVRRSQLNNHMSPSIANQTARSFFLPNLTHMNDFVSGTLRLSSVKNGIPIFVKHGKVHDQESRVAPDHHAELEAIAVSEDEEKIFVSLDKIREEIQALKEHDDLVTKQAEQLQEEVHELHIQIAKYRSRKDSAMGSDSDGSIVEHLNAQKSQLEEQIVALQARLDKANRKISINEIHTESYVAERDEALKTAASHVDKIKRLHLELNDAQSQLEALRNDNTRGGSARDPELRSLRNDNIAIREEWTSLLEENQSLRSHNTALAEQNSELKQDVKDLQSEFASVNEELESLRHKYEILSEEKSVLKQDNLSLERHNDKFYNENKDLKQKHSSLDRKSFALQRDVARLEEMLKVSNAEPGPASANDMNIKSRAEAQNRELARENAELEQQMIDMQADHSTKRMEFQQERRRLLATNEHLSKRLDEISRKFTQIVEESKEEMARYEEQQASLTQQLEQTTDRELALTSQLKKSADHEENLRHQLDRRTRAIQEARQITQEIKSFMNTTSRTKSTKVTRILDPKGKATLSEMSARSTTSQTDMPMQDDPTRHIDLTQGSDYASIFDQGEIPKLRDALRRAHIENQQQDLTDESLPDDVVTEEPSQSLPPPFMPDPLTRDSSLRATSTGSKTQGKSAKSQPLGILKISKPSRLNSQTKLKCTIQNHQHNDHETVETASEMRRARSEGIDSRKLQSNKKDARSDSGKAVASNSTKPDRQILEQDLTGRFSIKSGLSGMSIPSQTTQEEVFHRPHHASAQFDLEAHNDDNMTSALFIDDITLETEKKTAQEKQIKTSLPFLSTAAKRVLDDLNHDHDCANCMLCVRIRRHHGEDGKKVVRVSRPVPVSDRIPNAKLATATSDYEDQPTVRPSEDPALALAKVLKGLEDEEKHLQTALAKKQATYDACNPAWNKRTSARLEREMEHLRSHRRLKRAQIYGLTDVLEGQKENGQQMTDECVEVTISTILAQDPTWDGIMDY